MGPKAICVTKSDRFHNIRKLRNNIQNKQYETTEYLIVFEVLEHYPIESLLKRTGKDLLKAI